MRQFASAAIAAVMMVGGAVRTEAQQPTVQQVYDKFAEAVGGAGGVEVGGGSLR